jgi:hypothetical protein
VDGPFRSAPREVGVEAPRDRGIVGDVVAQFADKLAFYRELVQNAIDAGTQTVDVELRHDAGAAAMRVVVRDRGEGMDRELIENSLLVLFRSTKDRDPTKIGKFGIGFSSVLAPAPRVVVIDTARGGRRLVVHLHPDLSYQLFEAGPATRNGTAIELELPIEPGEVRGFVERSRDALLRWCRHASVPIRFIARGSRGEPLAEERIDIPLALEGALVQVRGVSADGETTAVVGLMPGAAVYSGFCNRGLMLHHSDQPLAGERVGFKVLDARLGHTLSRDDVRRNEAYDAALDLVRRLVRHDLRRAVALALAEAAVHDRARWRVLFEAIDAAQLTLGPDEWVLPLLAPIGDATVIAAERLPRRRRAWADIAPSPLVDALAAAGVPVVAVLAPGVRQRIASAAERALVDVHAVLTLVTGVTPDDAERAMFEHLARFLEDAEREPSEILLGELYGALGGRPWISGGPDHAEVVVDAQRWVIERDVGMANPFRRFRRRALVLNAGDPVTQGARRRAARDPLEAAAMLARSVLLHHGELDAAASERILHATVGRLGLGRDS